MALKIQQLVNTALIMMSDFVEINGKDFLKKIYIVYLKKILSKTLIATRAHYDCSIVAIIKTHALVYILL